MRLAPLALVAALTLSTPALAGDPGPPPDAAASRVARELQRKCDKKVDRASDNTEMKLRAADELDCKQGFVAKESARLGTGKLPLGKTAFLHETWKAYDTALCELVEEQAWVNLDEGYRDDGTARGYAAFGCHEVTLPERLLTLRLFRKADLKGFEQRLRKFVPAGEAYLSTLAALEKRALELAGNTPPPREDVIIPTDRDYWLGLAQQVRDTRAAATALATQTCSAWSALEAANGGLDACVKRLTAYHLGQSDAYATPDEP